MTNVVFDNLRGIIRNNKNTIKMNWYDGTKYIDPQGNWFGWTDCGYHESIFYAGELWTRTFGPDGKPTEPEKRAPIVPQPAAPQPVRTLRFCDLIGKPNACEECPYGTLIGMDEECPRFKDKAEAAHEMANAARAFLKAAEMLGV